MERLALIDFCSTIASFETLDPFLEFVIARERPSRRWLCAPVAKRALDFAGRALSKLTHRRCYLYKRALVRQLRGIERTQLEECGRDYYRQRICDHLVDAAVEKLRELREAGCRTMIVSGGSDFYIGHFAREFGVTDVISARFAFAGGACTGRFETECLGDEKIGELRAYMAREGIEGEFAAGMTDSRSDLPLLKLCERKIVVSRGGHQEWVKGDMEEIVWDA